MFDWFWKFVYGLLIGITGMVDFILDVFRVLCGMAPVIITEGSQKKEVDLLSHVLTSDTVYTAFWYVVFLGIGLLVLASAFMMIRLQYDPEQKKTPTSVIIKAFKSFLLFFMVPIIMVVGVVSVSTIMIQLDKATNPYFSQISGEDDGYSRTTIGGQVLISIGEDAWNGNYTEEEKDVVRSGFLMRKDGFNYLDFDDVRSYYDLSSLNYATGFLSGIVFIIILGLAMFSVTERLVNIVVLFIISPMPIAVSVVDDGHRFKLWRDQVLVKFISAYGVIIALNIYNLLMPIIQSLSFGIPLYGDDSDTMIAFTDGLIKIYILLGAAFAIYKAPTLIGNLVVQGAGSQEAADSAHSMATMGRLAGGAMGLAKAVASPVTKPLGWLGGQAADEAKTAMKAPVANARERNAKKRQMLSDNKLANQMKKKMTDVGKGTASGKDKKLVSGYHAGRQLNMGGLTGDQNAIDKHKQGQEAKNAAKQAKIASKQQGGLNKTQGAAAPATESAQQE